MPTLNPPGRYFQDSTPADVPCREENFIRRENYMELPVCQTTLVLVDVRKIHVIESHMERAGQVIREAIALVLKVGREIGITFVHAPSSPVARQFSQLQRYSLPESESPDDGRQKNSRNGSYICLI